MKIWLVERPEGADYDEYDAYVCVAESAEAALKMHEMGGYKTCVVKEVGTAADGMYGGVIIASFCAG